MRQEFDIPMQPDALLAEAKKGGFFSYVAGVAYQVLTHNTVKGLVIDNYATDLPVKKGLSSSAAVCVLTARAFNLAYDLKMTVRGEMDYAYRGEITTPSRCGRMDQGCAYGSRPVMMKFDGDSLDVSELACGADFHFIIADLKATKDTVKILADLNKAFPFAENDIERGVQDYLGRINQRILSEAAEALRAGDARAYWRSHDGGAGQFRQVRGARVSGAASISGPSQGVVLASPCAARAMAERAWAAREMALFSSWRVMRKAEKKPSVSWKRSSGSPACA